MLRFISGTNGFLPEATGQVIGYIRQPERFAINRYVQYVDTPKVIGVYAELGRDEPVRIKTDEEWAWHDGDDMPQEEGKNLMPFQWQEFRVFRRAIPWKLGYQAMEQADGSLKVKPIHVAAQLSKMMTLRTYNVITLLQTDSNWATGHFQDANTLNGGKGKWNLASDDPNSPNYNAIFETILAARQKIHLDTNGAVDTEDLRLILSPPAARTISQTAEIKNYVRQTDRLAGENQRGRRNGKWGMPDVYADVEIVIEDAMRVNENPKANGTEATDKRLFIKDSTSALLVSRVGGIDGDYGAPSFSTVQFYHHKGLLQMKAKDDPWNEVVRGAVVEQGKTVLAASHSGMRIKNIL